MIELSQSTSSESGADMDEKDNIIAAYKRMYDGMIAKHELEQGIRPELKSYPDSLDEYDTIFLCYPNWWNTLPMPVLGFIEHYDWNGKHIIPVNTSEGSGAGKSVDKIREVCSGATVDGAYELKGSEVDDKISQIESWAKGKV